MPVPPADPPFQDPALDPQHAWAYRPASPLPGAPDGPLSGLSFSVKDLFGVPGWPQYAGTRAPLPDFGASVLVRRLLDLGASAVGKTQLHEIALGITGMNAFGGTAHPADPARIPGGSSSGAAVSAALGQVDFALGTDTGGSIRVPAAWCGVVGYKPTKGHAAWSTKGVLPLSWTCDHAGPLARDLATVVRVHEALSGDRVQSRSWSGVRVGLWLPQNWVTAEVAQAVLSFAGRLEARGALTTPVELPEMLGAYTPIVLSEAAQVHAAALALSDPGFTPFTLGLLRQGQALSEDAVREAHALRAEYRAALDDLWSRVDVVLAPAVPTPPPLRGQEEVALPEGPVLLRRAVLRLSAPFSLLGVPALALPSSLPFVGVQLVAPRGADEPLLGLGLGLDI
ncbi:amidase [Deinococcus navajonensis]|uniref:Amidase n=1 Tax=Deinococcus navajonensis TaxID=309884 RepID=A0ABV8XK61_9DEIO